MDFNDRIVFCGFALLGFSLVGRKMRRLEQPDLPEPRLRNKAAGQTQAED